MDIETVRLFREVVSRTSITDAARRLFMSQQALSRKLAALEDELGHQLLNRSTPLTLTPAGKVFLRESNDILNAYEHMLRALDNLKMNPPGIVRIRDYGTGSFTGIFAGMLDILSREHPEIDVRFVRANEDDITLIETGDIDLGFVRTVAVDGAISLQKHPGLAYLPLASDTSPLVFGVRAGHPLLELDRPTLRDIARHRLAMPTDTDRGAFPLSVKRLFADQGIDVAIEHVYCDSSGEHFFEFFSGMDAGSVAFFTERSFSDYMSGPWLADRLTKIVPRDADYRVKAFAVYALASANPALPVVADTVRTVDGALSQEVCAG